MAPTPHSSGPAPHANERPAAGAAQPARRRGARGVQQKPMSPRPGLLDRSAWMRWLRPSPRQLWQILIGAGSLAIGVIGWHFASEANLNFIVNFSNIPTPYEVFVALMQNFGSEEFSTHILVSMQRVAISFLLAAVVGVAIGVLMGRLWYAHAIVAPYIELMRPIPAVAWIPLAILMWPTEEASIIFITFLGALFPIVLNTHHGVAQTPEVLVRAARSLGASRMAILWHVVLPAALPSIATGLAVGMGVAWFSLLAGEIISGQYGVGYFTWDAYSMVRTPDIIVGMLVIGALGTLSTYAVRAASKPFLRWQTKTR